MSCSSGRRASPDFHPAFSNWRRRAKVPVLLLNATALQQRPQLALHRHPAGGAAGAAGRGGGQERPLPPPLVPPGAQRGAQGATGWAMRWRPRPACPGFSNRWRWKTSTPTGWCAWWTAGSTTTRGSRGCWTRAARWCCAAMQAARWTIWTDPRTAPPRSSCGPIRFSWTACARPSTRTFRPRLDSRALQGLFFIHLKKDLPVRPQDWIACQDPNPGTHAGSRPALRGGARPAGQDRRHPDGSGHLLGGRGLRPDVQRLPDGRPGGPRAAGTP